MVHGMLHRGERRHGRSLDWNRGRRSAESAVRHKTSWASSKGSGVVVEVARRTLATDTARSWKRSGCGERREA
eukprot:11807843-Prorocentrum_lima.AAC.1